MTETITVEQFLLTFKGKNNTYVKNELPKERPEKGQKTKTKITQNEGKVDSELMAHHLDGDFGVGICPVNADGKCFMGILDIDSYGSKILKMFRFIREYSLPLVPVRSKSGGLHCYLFTQKSVSAKAMREALQKIIDNFSLETIYGKGKVEVFPKQDKAEGFGSCITLPYFNAEKAYTYVLDLDMRPLSLEEGIDYCKKHSVATLDVVDECIASLPYNDAPPCIQRALISEEVGAEDSGRNNFLYSFAIYAKKKYGSAFEDYVTEVNSSFESPIDDSALESLIASVRDHEYQYKCKDIPLNAFCLKAECKKREFGLGKERGHFTNIDYGQMKRYMSAEPYYIWQLRLHGTEEWKDVIFKDEGYLLDQRNFSKLCIRYLNVAPCRIKDDDWCAVLNSVLPSIENVEVTEETDTSGLATLRNSLVAYLANKQSRRDSPYQIKTGLCVREKKEGVTKYYFTHAGFTEYLRNQKIPYDMGMLRENLIRFGAKEDIFTYNSSLGEPRLIPCWSKVEDKDIDDAYITALEIEEGDKTYAKGTSVSEVTNAVTESAPEESGEKPYSEEDRKDAEALL